MKSLDTAVSDLNDVLPYEAGTEGTGNFTQFTPNRNGGVGDNVSSDPARANRIRGVGSAGSSGSGVNTAFGNSAVNTRIPVDLYRPPARPAGERQPYQRIMFRIPDRW